MAKRNVPIRYTSRDFDSIRDDLTNYAKRYYPDTFKDFSESSFGSLMLDTVAYVGDIMSFYLDYQTNESFLDSATEYDNVLRLSKQMGLSRPQPAQVLFSWRMFALIKRPMMWLPLLSTHQRVFRLATLSRPKDRSCQENLPPRLRQLGHLKDLRRLG